MLVVQLVAKQVI